MTISNDDIIAHIVPNTSREGSFNVAFQDIDSGLYFDEVKIFDSEDKAIRYAKETL